MDLACSNIKLCNIVCTARVTTPVYLQWLVHTFPFCEYNRRKFAAVTLRLYHPNATCLIFASGKIVCTGANCVHDTRSAFLNSLSLIRKCGYNSAELRDYNVENMVASLHWDFGICLESLRSCYPNQTSYERGLFPGLIWRPYIDGICGVLLIFATGRCVITGCTSEAILQNSREWLISQITNAIRMDATVRTDTLH